MKSIKTLFAVGFSLATVSAHAYTVNKVTTAVTNTNDQARAVAVWTNATTGDTKIAVAGRCNSAIDSCAALYNADLTLDTNFNGTGYRTDHFSNSKQPSWRNGFNTVAFQTDGKFVAAGSTQVQSSGVSDILVARYNQDGTLDTSFNDSSSSSTAGTVWLDINGGDVAFTMLIDSTGRIIVGGYNNGGFTIARLNPNGTVDSTCGTRGTSACKVTTAIGYNSQMKAMAFQGDKIVAVGYSASTNTSSSRDFALVRYNSNLTVDYIKTTNAAGSVAEDVAWGVTIDNSDSTNPNRIVAVGGLDNLMSANLFMVRYNQDGTLDSTFNGGAPYVFTNAFNARDVVVDASNNYLVFGGNSARFKAGRFIPGSTVTVDTTFNPSGSPAGIVDEPGISNSWVDSAMMPDGSTIMVGTSASDATTLTDFIVSRFTW